MTSITTINAADVIADSRSTINTNFSNLNSGKMEGVAASVDGGVVTFDGTGGKTASTSGIKVVTDGDDAWFEADITSADNENGYIALVANTRSSGVGANAELYAASSTSGNNGGGDIFCAAGSASGSGTGGIIEFDAGWADLTGDGGSVELYGGRGGSSSGSGGSCLLQAGDAAAGNSDGGWVILKPGVKSGSGADGVVHISKAGASIGASLSAANVASSTKVFTFPNQAGIISTVTSAASQPGTTPAALGQIFIDTMAAKVYISTGTSSSSDWKILN